MARLIYTLVFYLMLPAILLRLIYRAWRAPAYARRWRERFGWFDWQAPQGGLWVHAVSVGETIAAVPLIRALQQTYPNLPILVTTMTPTGSERVRALLGDSVQHVYAPYDLPGAIQRFLRKVRPCALVIMETELWPNTLRYCRRHKVPVILANARLSERSARGNGRVGALARPMLQDLSLIAAQSEADARRFRDLGVPAERVQVTGSIKYDMEPRADQLEEGGHLKERLGERFVWVAASTHEGEDEQVLEAHQALRRRFPSALLILVPRHPERFDSVYEKVRSQGLRALRRSSGTLPDAATNVWVGDTMGEMMVFFAAADAAFVGGSLVERGGHNPLEPAALGLPTLMGPHVFNFQDICNQLSAAEGLIYVGAGENLGARLVELAEDDLLRERIGAAGLAVVKRNQGALGRLLGLMRPLIGNK